MTAKKAEERQVTFVPSVSFEGFPNGVKTKFLAGVESAPIPASYLLLLRAKGLVDETPPTAEEEKKHVEDGQTGQPEGES